MEQIERFTQGIWLPVALSSDKIGIEAVKEDATFYIVAEIKIRNRTENDWANATLIASAPELRRELKRHCELCHIRHGDFEKKPEHARCFDCPTKYLLNRSGVDW